MRGKRLVVDPVTFTQGEVGDEDLKDERERYMTSTGLMSNRRNTPKTVHATV